MPEASETGSLVSLPRTALAELAIDIWRIGKRIARDPTTPTPVVLAWERATERLVDIGIAVEEHVDEDYHESMRVKVAHHEGGETNPKIVECLAPAVYFTASGSPTAELLRPAEVVVRGE